MTRADYMTILSHNLRRLPKADYDRAIEYLKNTLMKRGRHMSRRPSRIWARRRTLPGS